MAEKQLKPACLGPCYYYGIVGLDHCCLHPEEPRKMSKAPGRCERYVDFDFKPTGAMQRPARRLTPDEFLEKERINDAA